MSSWKLTDSSATSVATASALFLLDTIDGCVNRMTTSYTCTKQE